MQMVDLFSWWKWISVFVNFFLCICIFRVMIMICHGYRITLIYIIHERHFFSRGVIWFSVGCRWGDAGVFRLVGIFLSIWVFHLFIFDRLQGGFFLGSSGCPPIHNLFFAVRWWWYFFHTERWCPIRIIIDGFSSCGN
jgi:hypothetical protein